MNFGSLFQKAVAAISSWLSKPKNQEKVAELTKKGLKEGSKFLAKKLDEEEKGND